MRMRGNPQTLKLGPQSHLDSIVSPRHLSAPKSSNASHCMSAQAALATLEPNPLDSRNNRRISCRIFKILILPLAAIMLATPGLGEGNNNPSNMQEGPFAHAHGSISQPRIKDPGNCYVNDHAPQWALDVLIRRGHAAADDANGDTLTLTDPVWKYATCNERTRKLMEAVYSTSRV